MGLLDVCQLESEQAAQPRQVEGVRESRASEPVSVAVVPRLG